MAVSRSGVVLLVMLAAVLGTAGAGDDKELKALVDRSVKALGGADKLAKFKTCTVKSKITLFVGAEFGAVDYLTRKEALHDFLFSDYKLVDGARLSHKMIWSKDGKRFAVRETTEIAAVEQLDEQIFAEPKD
jgi:hypothetical protein